MDAQIEQFVASLQALNRHLRSSAFDAGSSPVTRVQWLLLRQLQRSGGATIGQLATMLDVRASTMSQMLDRLERSGFVTRTQDAVDARIRIVQLTEAGERTIRDSEQAWRRALAEPFAGLEEDERDRLVELMRKLTEQLPGTCMGTKPEAGEGASIGKDSCTDTSADTSADTGRG